MTSLHFELYLRPWNADSLTFTGEDVAVNSFAYITKSAGNNVMKCAVSLAGDLSSCADSGSGATLTNATGITYTVIP